MHTFDEYKQALEGAGPKLTEMLLSRAANDRELDFTEFVRLCKLAYPETA